MARKKKTEIPSLSSVEALPYNIETSKKDSKEEVMKKVFDAISDLELQKSIDKWLKDNKKEEIITNRDLGILKGIMTEYLDAFLMVGYTPKGERVILQNFKSARDRDAIMEFFKTVFIKQQHENFLDLEEE